MAGNGNMAPTYGPQTNDSYPTAGGNTHLINGNEAAVVPTQEQMAVRSGPLSNEDDSHVQGVYREQDFAGS
jgi:hypothetical protein